MNPDPNSHEPHPDEGADYNERFDISRIHDAVMREKVDPQDGSEPLSLFIVMLFGIALFLGGGYLTLYSGGFRNDVFTIYSGPSGDAAKVGGSGGSTTAVAAKEPSLAEQGEKVFKQNCVACHQASGMGLAGQYPPLAGSTYVIGSEKRLVGILLHGVQGDLTVEGVKYNGAMPAWGKALSDKKIAAVASYIRSSWGNTAPEIQEATIKAGREAFKDRSASWTGAELDAIPADATLP